MNRKLKLDAIKEQHDRYKVYGMHTYYFRDYIIKHVGKMSQKDRFLMFVEVKPFYKYFKSTVYFIAEPLYKSVLKDIENKDNELLRFSRETYLVTDDMFQKGYEESKKNIGTGVVAKGKQHNFNLISGKEKPKNFNEWISLTGQNLNVTKTKYENIALKKIKGILGNNCMKYHVSQQNSCKIDGKVYFPDIMISKLKIIIEVDGGYHNTEEQKERDKKRDIALTSKGFTVHRFSNEQVITESFENEVKNIIDTRILWYTNMQKLKANKRLKSKK